MMHRSTPPLRWMLAVSLVWTTVAPASAGSVADLAKVDFNRDIRPILSEHCYACHGPDEPKRKAGLRLDVQEGAFKLLKSGNHAIVPGKLAESTLAERTGSSDP